MKNGIFKSQPGAPLKRTALHAPGPCINTPAVGFCFMIPPESFVSSGYGAAFHAKSRNAPPKKIGFTGGHRRNTLSCRVGYESIKELAAARPFTQGFARAGSTTVVELPQSLDAALIEKGGNWEMSEQSFFHCAQKNPTGEKGLPGIPFLLHYWGNGDIVKDTAGRPLAVVNARAVLDSTRSGGGSPPVSPFFGG